MLKYFSLRSLLLLSIVPVGCRPPSKDKGIVNQHDEHEFTNKLVHESSPYLLQHAHNPVHWYPWGEEALKKARDEHKMLIISIGYAACHWCHVMEHESFEDTAVAYLMNTYFVAIKVDREERPDVDQVYMDAAYLINGSGGWPLNALALPDGKPFFAGTYFPKADWVKVLRYFVDLHAKNPALLNDEAEKITQGIHAIENIVPNIDPSILSLNDLNEIFTRWKPNIDFDKGSGFRAPKFPMPSNWEYLLHYYHLSKNRDALKAVTATLDNIALGGIYDQVGGGFARYSTDANWLVPHFEKMLYDNAQLVSLYAHAFQATKNQLYKNVVYETLGFIARELTAQEGGFYSSLDADSEGEEGKFYVWTKKDFEKVVGEHAELLNDYYSITETGNWEHGKNILHRKQTDVEFANNHTINVVALQTLITNQKEVVLRSRNNRIRPALDDKIITAWNALMLKGYAEAYRAFGEERFLDAALKNAKFLCDHAISTAHEITRNYKNGKATIPALLDDYAFTISAFIALYQATFDEQWLYKAKELTDYTILHFHDTVSGMFYYTHNQHANLIARKMEIADNVIPSSNSAMASNLLALGLYFDVPLYAQLAKQMVLNVQHEMRQNMPYYANWGITATHFIQEPFEVAVMGDNFHEIRQSIDAHYLPNLLLLGGKTEGSLTLLANKLIRNQTTIYVCRNKVCQLPVQDVEEALKQLE